MGEFLSDKSFDIVFCDEGSQCIEPSNLIPIILKDCKQIVIIGDHQQLPPGINFKNNYYYNIVIKCDDKKLSLSLFER
jgi:superfamily I DNA and/or RNA helicase